MWLNNRTLEGQILPIGQVRLLADSSEVKDFPVDSKRTVLLIWVSWCRPCQFEMNRLSRAIEKGDIPADRVYALNPYEHPDEIQNFLSERDYKFQFIQLSGPSPHFFEALEIRGTPTIIKLKGNKVHSMTTGVNPLLPSQISRFLAP